MKACHYLGKHQESNVIVKFVYFCKKKFIWRSEESLKDIVNKTRYPVYLTERLPPKCRQLQLEAKQMGIKTGTNTCELQVLNPRKESGLTFRPVHTKAELLKLKNVALPLRNINTRDNRRIGKRNNNGSTGLSLKNQISKPQKTSGEHMLNA